MKKHIFILMLMIVATQSQCMDINYPKTIENIIQQFKQTPHASLHLTLTHEATDNPSDLIEQVTMLLDDDTPTPEQMQNILRNFNWKTAQRNQVSDTIKKHMRHFLLMKQANDQFDIKEQILNKNNKHIQVIFNTKVSLQTLASIYLQVPYIKCIASQ